MKYKELEEIQEVLVKENVDLKNYSTFKLISRGDLIIVKSKDALIKTIKCLNRLQVSYNVLGKGSNQIIKSRTSSPFIKLEFNFDRTYLDKVRDEYIVPASLNLASLTKTACSLGLSGWEFFTGIPATVGGAVFMNAGTKYGEIGSLVRKVSYINKGGEDISHIVNNSSFKYRKNTFLERGDIIYEITLSHSGVDKKIKGVIQDYLKKRNVEQPLDKNTCGCVFKNIKKPELISIGKLIDISGLKGFSVGDICINSKHANFFENCGNGTYEDFSEMIDCVRNEIKLQFGFSVESEVKY